ncbi:MAG TPA: DNA mismatch repair endonuclease MutL [Bacteriovoracaceae bacterium]|nr:DNA mismatch repair endonuclease MutL [Bacteriovoracaceae bacterium]
MAGDVPPRIELLPEHLIDQIKAGEVIERPGSLIKEILENAVDARATKIELTLKNNGLDLISLKDNGHGMRFEDLPLAFCRHATSKLTRFEDLYRLSSFGFRGEALASIASISRVHCVSISRGSDKASEIRIDGGEITFHGHRMTPQPGHGTELVIQDLFYNTPARLKFIQSQQTEKQYIKRIIHAFVLSHPQIEFQLKVDEGDKDFIGISPSVRDRLISLIPRASALLSFAQKFYENNELDVYLIPGQIKAPFKCQYIFINGRYVIDKQLTRVVCNALGAAFGSDDFHYLIFFSLPPDAIDVNVHPNKTVIKFMETSKLLSLLTSTIREMVPKASAPQQTPTALLDGSSELPTLSGERQGYNMEGHFSPHRLPSELKESLFWADPYFLIRAQDKWLAVLPWKLLEHYCARELLRESGTIPLLVSEPFPAKDIRPERITDLQRAGVELEFLGKDTLVLRSIPEWMNGFPLRAVLDPLLREDSFETLRIQRSEWSESTWEELFSSFTLEYLFKSHIAGDLSLLLGETLK